MNIRFIYLFATLVIAIGLSALVENTEVYAGKGPVYFSSQTMKHKERKGVKNRSTAVSMPIETKKYNIERTVITTVFWAGETANTDNGFIANSSSSWDENWQTHYGGIDDPTRRNGYLPAGFTPHENPFYFALPYSDVDSTGKRKATAHLCPNSKHSPLRSFSWCKNSWIVITAHGRKVYAQWEDTGPYSTDDTAYVFGSEAPKNTYGAKAGLDVSPAVRDYLGLKDVDKASWCFVDHSKVPEGPWKKIVTTSKGMRYY